MENASKALIIAGAILLAIAIIGVAMAVFTGVSDTILGGGDSLTAQEIQAYNQKFTTYEGDKRGTLARNLCDSVSAHNRGAEDASETIAIQWDTVLDAGTDYPAPTQDNATGTTTAEINTIKNQILSGRTYTISLGFDEDTGLVTTIGIKLVQ